MAQETKLVRVRCLRHAILSRILRPMIQQVQRRVSGPQRCRRTRIGGRLALAMGASEVAGDDGASDNMVGGLSVTPKICSGKIHAINTL